MCVGDPIVPTPRPSTTCGSPHDGSGKRSRPGAPCSSPGPPPPHVAACATCAAGSAQCATPRSSGRTWPHAARAPNCRCASRSSPCCAASSAASRAGGEQPHAAPRPVGSRRSASGSAPRRTASRAASSSDRTHGRLPWRAPGVDARKLAAPWGSPPVRRAATACSTRRASPSRRIGTLPRPWARSTLRARRAWSIRSGSGRCAACSGASGSCMTARSCWLCSTG